MNHLPTSDADARPENGDGLPAGANAAAVPGGRSWRRRALGIGAFAGVALAAIGGGTAVASSLDQDDVSGQSGVVTDQPSTQEGATEPPAPGGRPDTQGSGDEGSVPSPPDADSGESGGAGGEDCGPGGAPGAGERQGSPGQGPDDAATPDSESEDSADA